MQGGKERTTEPYQLYGEEVRDEANVADGEILVTSAPWYFVLVILR